MAAGGYAGCGYGLISEGSPPFIALIGEDEPGMVSVLDLLHDWVKLSGPNSIKLEILLDGPGYIISVSHEHHLLRWRVCGIDSVDENLTFTMNVSKELTTRDPFLERLLEYERSPIAPVHLLTGVLNGRGGFRNVGTSSIVLPGIDIYARPEDRRVGSMIRLSTEMVEKAKGASVPSTDREELARRREQRLRGTMPKTIHALRRTGDFTAHFAAAEAAGCSRWQVEQAICNLRLAKAIPYAARSERKRLRMVAETRQTYVEPATARMDATEVTSEAVVEQVSRDSAFLLRRLDEAEPAEQTDARLMRLRDLGYV